MGVRLRLLRASANLLIVALAGLLLGACASTITRNPVPSGELDQAATVDHLPSVRYWGDEVTTDIATEVRRRLPGFKKAAVSGEREGGRPVVNMLALSGGGPDGAFGAGLLAGWTASGTRPEFQVVTGISAGALIAPFAFLGPRYDDVLQEIWTQYETTELVTAQVLPGLLGGTSLADTAPLMKLMEKYVTRQVLDEIGREYRKGRVLLVGTTNLDAQRPVVWNMGEIAISHYSHALDLFRKVLMASAAIPGAFPPVNIPVEINGQQYEEMHVDGGVTRELFVAPAQVPLRQFDSFYDERPKRRIYIIKNGKFAPTYQPVAPQTLSIAARSIATLIIAQSWGDVYRSYRQALDDGADFNVVSVPKEFNVQAKQAFDRDYQKALYEEGLGIGKSGHIWTKMPPELIPRKPSRPQGS